jgi:hypothetical protein
VGHHKVKEGKVNIHTRATQLIVVVIAAVLTVIVIGCNGDEDGAPETPSTTGQETATATAEPGLTPEPTPSPTAPPETGGMDGFRTFAQQIEQAIASGDTQFFIDRARLSEITCPEEPAEVIDPRCLGEPGGTVIEGVFAGAWRSEAHLLALDSLRDDLANGLASLSSPVLYAIGDQSSWASEPNTLANLHGFENAFFAVVTSSDDSSNATLVLTFEFPSDEARWLLAVVTSALTSTGAEEWLSGDCTECYDHWERWESTP